MTSPGNGCVECLLKSGFDVWLLDWGVPDERDAQNRLEDYVDAYLPAGITQILELLAHYVEETWAAMATVGLQEVMEA